MKIEWNEKSVWAMRGAGDTVVGDAVLAAWRQHTSADFKTRLFPGGHFFLREDRELLCDALCTSLLRYLRAIH